MRRRIMNKVALWRGAVVRPLSRWCVALAAMASVLLAGCYDDGVEGDSYYVFVGQTIGDFLDADSRYSDFSALLQRAGVKGLMYAYGEYTCLAPTNDAVQLYIRENYPDCTLETLPDSVVEALAKSHLIGEEYLTSDMSTGYLAQPNMYDRRVQVNIEKEYDASLNDSTTVYVFNNSAKIIQGNDTVSNGVVHTVDHVLEQSSYLLPDFMANRCEAEGFTLFMEALRRTGLNNSILPERDDSPEMLERLAQYAANYTGDGQKVPSARRFGFTVFVEKDEIYAQIYDPQNQVKPIYTGDLEADLQSLANYAKEIYDEVYPEDAGLYDNDYTHPRNPLHRFIAYHILPRNVGYSDLVLPTSDWSVPEGGDHEEYYETMAGPLLRLQMVSRYGNEIYLDRCERDNNLMGGVRVLRSGNASTVNGNYQFIDRVLAYTTGVKNMFLTERIRIDTGSLLAELTNNNVRNDADVEMLGWYFPTGYFESVSYDDQCECFYNRWPIQRSDATDGWSHEDLMAFKLDNMNFGGEYDVWFRIPEVPAGTYEIRIGYVANGYMAISQIYFGYDTENMEPTGIPLDLSMGGGAPKVGMIADGALFDDRIYDISMNTQGLPTITENDKAMRNQGYMKGPDAMYRVNIDRVTKGTCCTDDWWYLRHIVTTKDLRGEPFYLRFRNVDERTGRMLNIDFIELCPRSVYNGAVLEDRY